MIFNIIFELIFLVIPFVSTLSPLSLTKPVNEGLGVNIHFTHPKDGELEMIATAGFKWVRMDFFWGGIEKTKGVYNFTDYDFLMSELVKHNMSAIFILDYGNTLYDKFNVVITEAGRKAYARWAATAVDHFKGRGIIWEIWNEPNLNVNWKHDVQLFTAMALEAGKEIRAKTPDEIIIGPAAAGVDLGFLEECFKAGLLNYWDAVSVHPYRQSGPENVVLDYDQLKVLIKKYESKGKSIPIISGEWGYSSVWNNINETIQGKYLPRELLTNVMNKIPISIWYDWHDDGTNIKDAEHNFGIVKFEYHNGGHPVYTPKEAYLSAKTMTTVLNGFHYVKRIAVNDANDYVMLFSNGYDLRLVVWSTTAKSHKITIPSDKCDFEIIHHKGEPHENVTAKNGSLTLTLNDFTHFIIVKGPNHALENASDANYYRADIAPIHGKSLAVTVYKPYGTDVIGKVRLTNINGIEPIETEAHFEHFNDLEKVFNFPLKLKPVNEFTVGLEVESEGNTQNFEAHTFHFLPNTVLGDCSITPDGDPKVHSEQSVSIHSLPDTTLPQPLFDSDLLVLQIDYHFYGQGWKYLNVHPNKAETRKIPGLPKAFGIWVYGDNQKMTIKIRINDSTHQMFQIRPDSRLTIDWNGWRYVRFNLNDSESHVGGRNDGKVHYPIEWETLFLLDNEFHSDINSTIYITSPVVIY